ncbi:MAG: threonine synthase [Alphaproteobacteria bacterium HGW-Alphaproteobacteria-7]|jgi:threonine synthase|nr:MAG: threonine synthase [Alphaproteobacteria bacterium HGW-Alphaproteobacteria-7]
MTTPREYFVSHLECGLTGTRHEAGQIHGLSPAGRPLLVRYDLDALRAAVTRETFAARPTTLWKWRELLPLADFSNRLELGEVATPILPLERTAARLGGRAVLVKDEGRLPTGSFKARGLALALSMAKELGIAKIAMPTNGNAGAAAAAYAAAGGIEAVIFAPEETPEINIREIAAYGARVYRVNGQIDDCGKLVAAGKDAQGWFDLSTLKEPYRIEGKKTMGLELVEQLGWRVPDVIFYPTGGGTGMIGMWKAFAELEAIGLIGPERPRMVAVQAEGCAPMVRAFEQGERHAVRWDDPATVAAGIRVPQAVGDFLILDAVRESGGFAIAVSDAAIEDAVSAVARDDGTLLCPEGGATLAAYEKARRNGLVSADEEVLLFNCASGLKYPLADQSRRLDRHQPIDWANL